MKKYGSQHEGALHRFIDEYSGDTDSPDADGQIEGALVNHISNPLSKRSTSSTSKFVQKKQADPSLPALAPASPRTVKNVFSEQGAQVEAEAWALEGEQVGGGFDIVSPRLEKFLMGEADVSIETS